MNDSEETEAKRRDKRQSKELEIESACASPETHDCVREREKEGN